MHTLRVTLKQHTPLIHFQHDQDGATLRASEVKPKLDRYILTKLGEQNYNVISQEDYDEVAGIYDDRNPNNSYEALDVQQQYYEVGKFVAKQNGWLVGKGEHPALDYKMRIIADNPVDCSMRVNSIGENDEIGREKFTTPNYPDNTNSLIMGNIGGRIIEDVLNFVLFNSVEIIFFVNSDTLKEVIEENLPLFFLRNNMGNRTSKGFGSFLVHSIDDTLIKYEKKCGYKTISFDIVKDDYKNSRITCRNGMRIVFYCINKMWKMLKKYGFNNVVPDCPSNVFLNRNNTLQGNEERVPSPLFFKPVITRNAEEWNVRIHIFPDYDVIRQGGAQGNDFKKIIDELIKNVQLKDEYCYNGYIINNITIQ